MASPGRRAASGSCPAAEHGVVAGLSNGQVGARGEFEPVRTRPQPAPEGEGCCEFLNVQGNPSGAIVELARQGRTERPSQHARGERSRLRCVKRVDGNLSQQVGPAQLIRSLRGGAGAPPRRSGKGPRPPSGTSASRGSSSSVALSAHCRSSRIKCCGRPPGNCGQRLANRLAQHGSIGGASMAGPSSGSSRARYGARAPYSDGDSASARGQRALIAAQCSGSDRAIGRCGILLRRAAQHQQARVRQASLQQVRLADPRASPPSSTTPGRSVPTQPPAPRSPRPVPPPARSDHRRHARRALPAGPLQANRDPEAHATRQRSSIIQRRTEDSTAQDTCEDTCMHP